MELEGWIKRYEEKAERFTLIPGFIPYFEPDKGFFFWHVWQDVFEVGHTCTNDYKHFNEVANNIAKMYHCKILRTATKHNPASYMRLQRGATLNLSLSGIHKNGNMYWVFERPVKGLFNGI